MKTMQEFYNWLSSEGNRSSSVKRRLVRLQRLTASRIHSLAVFEPWWIWSAGASPSET